MDNTTIKDALEKELRSVLSEKGTEEAIKCLVNAIPPNARLRAAMRIDRIGSNVKASTFARKWAAFGASPATIKRVMKRPK